MSLATLSTVISMLRQKLSEAFSAQRAPSGYRPGVTLEYLRRNLGLASFTTTGPARAELVLPAPGVRVELVERTESQLLMHLVMTEFRVTASTSEEGNARVELHHRGALRRTGLGYRQRTGEPALLTRLQAGLEHDSTLHQALMLLDFKRLSIELSGREWQVRLEHMGGSEVVNRMPAFRRYIALSGEQRDHLLTVLAGLPPLLSQL